MKAVFADTGFFLAVINPRDQYYQAATQLNATLVAPLLTTAWVLLEFANAVATSRARGHFKTILTRLSSEPDAEIIEPNAELFNRGCELYTSRPDKEWSLTDLYLVRRDERARPHRCADGGSPFRASRFRGVAEIAENKRRKLEESRIREVSD